MPRLLLLLVVVRMLKLTVSAAARLQRDYPSQFSTELNQCAPPPPVYADSRSLGDNDHDDDDDNVDA